MKFSLNLLIVYALFTCGLKSLATEFTSQESYFTEDFQPVSIKRQIEEYRFIYDEILRQNPKNPHLHHSPRFFAKLQNAFKLIRKYIQSKTVIDENGQNIDQDTHLKYLDTLYQVAVKLNEQREISPVIFERLNSICALIGSAYSHYDTGSRFYFWDTICLWRDNTKPALESGVDATVELIKTGVNALFIGEVDKPLRLQETKQFTPSAILYMDKNIGIGYQSFVNQFFKEPYPLFLATFFPSPLPTTEEEMKNRRKTKHDVHHSKVIDPFIMLSHDLEHRQAISALIADFERNFTSSFNEYLKPAYDQIEHANPQESKVLYAGLFLLIHELQSTRLHTLNSQRNTKKLDKHSVFKLIVEGFEEHTKSKLENRASDDYKTFYRDNEYVLYWAKNKDQKPFLPLLKVDGKEKFLPVALNQNKLPVIILERSPTGFKIRDFASINISTEITVDKDDNLKLPVGWSFMSLHQRRYEDSRFQNSYTKRLPERRHSTAAQYLIKGYHDFWNEFKAIAEPGYVDMYKRMHSCF